MSLLARLEAKVTPEPNSGCWLWLGARVPAGYGTLSVDGKTMLAHRASWLAHNGPIPWEAQVCHRCDNPLCINPRHLFVGTALDNMRDKDRKGRGRCVGAKNPARGMRNCMARLDDQRVASIVTEYQRGDISQRQLAAKHAVSQSAVCAWVNGRVRTGGAR